MVGSHRAAVVEPQEVTLLADMLGQLRQMLDSRQVRQDPLAELTGIQVGRSTVPEDPALARLLPDFAADDEQLSAGLRILHEPELIAAKKAAIDTLLDSLPPGGGTVLFTREVAVGWMQAINDLRLVLATRLEIVDDDYQPSDDPEEQTMYEGYLWLSDVLDALVQTHPTG